MSEYTGPVTTTTPEEVGNAKHFEGQAVDSRYVTVLMGQARDPFLVCRKCGCFVFEATIHGTVTCAAITTFAAPDLSKRTDDDV